MSKGGSPTCINITDEVKAIVKKAASKRVLSASFRRIQPVLYFMKNSYKTECLTEKSPFSRTLKTVWKKSFPYITAEVHTTIRVKTLRRC